MATNPSFLLLSQKDWFDIKDKNGDAEIFSNANFDTNYGKGEKGDVYTVIGFDKNNFNHVQVLCPNGDTAYGDYTQFNIKGIFDDKTISEYLAACHEAVRIEQENNEKAAQTYEDTGSSTSSAVYDSDGDEIVGPYMPKAGFESDAVMSAQVKTYGMPPQWTKYVDPRVYGFYLNFKSNSVPSTKCALGRRFLEVTISRPTIIEIAPGRVYYPTKGMGSKEDYAMKLNQFMGGAENVKSIVNDDLASFFTIKPCYNDSPDGKIHGYISYVSVLMRVFASFLSRNHGTDERHYYSKSSNGINELDDNRTGKQFADRAVPVFAVSYKKFTWHQYDGEGSYAEGALTKNFPISDSDGQYGTVTTLNSGLTEDGFTYIRFFGLNGTRSSDTFDTSLTDTQMASMLNGATGGIKDAAFFISGVIGNKLDDDLHSAEEELKKFANGSGQAGMFSALLDSTAEIVRGGKVNFPKIIDDCDYGKSLSIECVFTSVYGDPEAIYLNTIAGLVHILAMALPHQVRSSIEIYTYPYIVKAFCKGIFNCPMGVVSGLTIDYAGESGDLWSLDTIPSEIKVSFQITPLITKLALTSENDSSGWLLRNNGLQEYIATVAGSDLRMDKVDLATELYGIMFQNKLASMEANAWQRLVDRFLTSSVGRFGSNIYNAIIDPDFTLNDLIDNMFS